MDNWSFLFSSYNQRRRTLLMFSIHFSVRQTYLCYYSVGWKANICEVNNTVSVDCKSPWFFLAMTIILLHSSSCKYWHASLIKGRGSGACVCVCVCVFVCVMLCWVNSAKRDLQRLYENLKIFSDQYETAVQQITLWWAARVWLINGKHWKPFYKVIGVVSTLLNDKWVKVFTEYNSL